MYVFHLFSAAFVALEALLVNHLSGAPSRGASDGTDRVSNATHYDRRTQECDKFVRQFKCINKSIEIERRLRNN